MVLSCLPGASLVPRKRPVCGRSPPQDLPRSGPLANEIVLKVNQIRRPSKIGIRSVLREGLYRQSCATRGPFLCRLSNWFFPVSLVPPWCLPGCRLSNGSFPASLVPRKLSNESFPASLVPLRLSKWSFPVSLVPPCDRQSCALSGALKACLCSEPKDPALGPLRFGS